MGNDRILPHFHPVKGSGGYGVVEHEPHRGLPDRSHTHVDDPNLAVSVPELPMPPGAMSAPIAPGRRGLQYDGRRPGTGRPRRAA